MKNHGLTKGAHDALYLGDRDIWHLDDVLDSSHEDMTGAIVQLD